MDKLHENAKLLAWIRGERTTDVLQRFSSDTLTGIRKLNKHITMLRDIGLVEMKCRDGLAYVKLENGRIFYSYPSKKTTDGCIT